MMTQMPSIAAQLDLNDIPEGADEPGPGHYFGPESSGFSSLGIQRFSKNRSEPTISMATTGWENWQKVHISKGHIAGAKGRDAPGPGTYGLTKRGGNMEELSSLGKHTTKVGTSLRPDLSSTLGVDPHGSPGPAYNIATLHHRAGILSHKSAEKSVKIGKQPRFQVPAGLDVGPGQYDRKDVALQGSTGKSFGIGRSFYDKVIRPGWEREGQGKEGSGPGPPLWRDIDKEGSRPHAIPKQQRFKQDREKAATPGPGAYNRDERNVSTLKSCCSDTRNPGGCKFGKPPRKPRIRQHLAQVISNHHGGMWGYF
jgi:hypothetical protein